MKKYIPYLLFLLVTIILFHEFLFTSNGVLFSSDQLESGIFFRKLYADFFTQYWEFPLWDRFISGGIPFIDATHGDTFYPAAFMKFFIPLYKALGLKLVLHVFLSGIFMFIALKTYGLKKYSAIFGSIAYMTAPMIVTLVYPGHDAKMYVAALLPLAFNFLHKGLRDNKIKDMLLFGSVVGFMILSSHVQTTYFSLWFLFFYAVYKLISEYVENKDIKPVSKKFSLFWLGIVLALFIGAVQLIPPYIYSKQFSIRGTEAKTTFEHACSWGMHPEEAFSVIVPEFCGDNRLSHVQDRDEYEKVLKDGGYSSLKEFQEVSSGNYKGSYWGRNAFKLNSEYSGVIILFLSILAIFIYRGKFRKDVIFFMSFGLFTLLYALVDHTPLFWLAYKIIPGVNLFRGQGMILFILSFVLAFVSSILVDQISDRNDEVSPKTSKKLLYIIPSIFIIGLIFSFSLSGVMSIYKSIFSPIKMPDENYLSIIRQGIIFSSLLISLSGLSIYLFLKKNINLITFITIITALVFIDSYRINRKFIKTVDKAGLGIKFEDISLTKQLRELESKEGYFRVFNLNMFGDNQLPIHGVTTVKGFHDNELKWYRKFRGINEQGVNNDTNLTEDLNNFQDNNFLSLAGARFLLYKDKEGKTDIIPNPTYQPRAFVVSGYEIIEDEDKIVQRLKGDIDVSKTVILEKEPSLTFVDSIVAGEVTNYKYDGNEVYIEVDMQNNGLVVMTDNYFPYWHAYDESGKEIEILKADLTFRAIELPKGKHRITFKYISKPYLIGKTMSIVGVLVVIVLIVLGFRKRKKEL
ncbi:MAG: hypothetical protein PF638_06715 [Candidatus Delongbacteria bacterium]|jgi:hypothetical protein|nr:hypothetical protein [Candidatus Delongbacteria bacterium]